MVGLQRRSPRHLPRVRESHEVAVERHLEAASARPARWGEAKLAIGPQAEVLIRERVGDLTQELKPVKDERQAVGDEARRDLHLEMEVWGGGVAAVTELAQQLATTNALSNMNTDRARFHVRIEQVDPRA